MGALCAEEGQGPAVQGSCGGAHLGWLLLALGRRKGDLGRTRRAAPQLGQRLRGLLELVDDIAGQAPLPCVPGTRPTGPLDQVLLAVATLALLDDVLDVPCAVGVQAGVVTLVDVVKLLGLERRRRDLHAQALVLLRVREVVALREAVKLDRHLGLRGSAGLVDDGGVVPDSAGVLGLQPAAYIDARGRQQVARLGSHAAGT